jgi:hypothetical protein
MKKKALNMKLFVIKEAKCKQSSNENTNKNKSISGHNGSLKKI